MSLMLNCPQCDGPTELRGTMDAWYLTWCPECERLWRFDVRSLLDDDSGGSALESPRQRRARPRPRA